MTLEGTTRKLHIATMLITWALFCVCLVVGVIIYIHPDPLMMVLSRILENPFKQRTSQELEVGAASLFCASVFLFIAGVLQIITFLPKNPNPVLNIIYIILVFATIATITSTACGFTFIRKVDDFYKQSLGRIIESTYAGVTADKPQTLTETLTLLENGNSYSLALDFAQYYYECCGVSDYSDFLELASEWERDYSWTGSDGTTIEISNAVVPITCCKTNKSDSTYPTHVTFRDVQQCLQTAYKSVTHHKGCYSVLNSVYQKKGTNLASVSLFVTVTLTACLIAALITKCQNKKSDEAVTSSNEKANWKCSLIWISTISGAVILAAAIVLFILAQAEIGGTVLVIACFVCEVVGVGCCFLKEDDTGEGTSCHFNCENSCNNNVCICINICNDNKVYP